MEIVKAAGEPDKIRVNDKIMTRGELSTKLLYTPEGKSTVFYREDPWGNPKLFELPYYFEEHGCHEIEKHFLLPQKITCDVWVNKDFKISSILCKLAWINDQETVAFSEWMRDMENEIQLWKDFLEQARPLNLKARRLFDKADRIKRKLEKTVVYSSENEKVNCERCDKSESESEEED